jgi:drug/metabolite transporter (DMT)-like permease
MTGGVVSMLGWPLQVTALILAPLVVVQPTLAVGLIVLVFLAQRMLGERAGRYEYLTMAAILVGVVGVGLTAPHVTTNYKMHFLRIAIALTVLGAASVIPYLFHLAKRRSPATTTIVCAGLAFAWSGVSTKLAADDLARGHLLGALAWALATAVAGGLGTLSEMSALQSRPLIQVSPVVLVTQTIVPIMLAPVLFGEKFHTTPFHGIPLLISLVLLITNAALLARSSLLVTLMEGEEELAK